MAARTETMQERLRDIAGWMGDWDQDGDSAELTRVAATLDDLLAALKLAEDVLSRFPFSSELWPNGTHPNTGITQIRAAIAKAEGRSDG